MLTMMAGSDQARQNVMRSVQPKELKEIMYKMSRITKGCNGD